MAKKLAKLQFVKFVLIKLRLRLTQFVAPITEIYF